MTDDMLQWNGNSYDTDPASLTMGELETLSQRCEITGFQDLIERLKRVDHIGWKAMFWTQDRRRQPDLRWDGYDGPSLRVLLDAGVARAGKTAEPEDEQEGKAPTEADGSEPSPTSSDTPPPSSTP